MKLVRLILMGVMLLTGTLGLAAEKAPPTVKKMTRTQAQKECVGDVNALLLADSKLHDQALEVTRRMGISLNDYIAEFCKNSVEEAIRQGKIELVVLTETTELQGNNTLPVRHTDKLLTREQWQKKCETDIAEMVARSPEARAIVEESAKASKMPVDVYISSACSATINERIRLKLLRVLEST